MAQDPEMEKLDITDELIAERRSEAPGETPEDMHPLSRKIVGNIDIFSNWVGKITCFMLLPVMLSMVYEVVARKLFIAPTDWAYDTSRMFAGAMFMMGAGYALMRGVHIRADFLFRTWKPVNQARVDTVLYLLFYFPAMLFFFWLSAEYTYKSWITWERSMDTALMAPLAPARTAMPLGALFLILQGIAELLRCRYQLDVQWRRWLDRFLPLYAIVLCAIFMETFFRIFCR